MRRLYMLQIGIVLLTSVVLAQKDIKPPETFTASAQVLGNNAGSSAQVTIQINQYTSDKDRRRSRRRCGSAAIRASFPHCAARRKWASSR